MGTALNIKRCCLIQLFDALEADTENRTDKDMDNNVTSSEVAAMHIMQHKYNSYELRFIFTSGLCNNIDVSTTMLTDRFSGFLF